MSPSTRDLEREPQLDRSYDRYVQPEDRSTASSRASWKERNIYGELSIRAPPTDAAGTSHTAGVSHTSPRAALYTTVENIDPNRNGDYRFQASKASSESLTTVDLEKLTALAPREHSVTMATSHPAPPSSSDSGDLRVDNSDISPIIRKDNH